MESATSLGTEGYTYFAFISYKSEDERYARRLRRSLQTYRLPTSTHKRYPKLPKRCSPVFLDRVDLTPGVLDQRLRDEVSSSKFLIVICSKHAGEESRYLDDELAYFLESGGDPSRVIPFIVDESDRAEQECFPKGLRELCARQNVVGPSIHDDGWHSAVIKIVARMHGIRRVELESDDLRRRNRLCAIGAVLAVVAVLVGWRLYDHFSVKTHYYLDYAEVYGVPVGIHELSESEASSVGMRWAILTSQGMVCELRCENSSGRLVTPTALHIQDRPARALYSYEDGELAGVTRQDERERPVLELSYANRGTIDLMRHDEDEGSGTGSSFVSAVALSSHTTRDSFGTQLTNQRSDVIRYLVEYDDKGFVKELRYVSDAYNSVGTDADGISGIRYERDDLGRATRTSYLTYDGTDRRADRAQSFVIVGKPTGVAGVEYTYDEDDDLAQTRFFDANSQTFPNEDNICVCKMEYQNHCVVRQSAYDASGSPVLERSTGYSAATITYDSRGNVVEVHYLGTDGKPVLRKDGYASSRQECDAHGNVVRVQFFGTDGEPVIGGSGFSSARSEYDADGHMIAAYYYGTDGEPVLHHDGNASFERTYDARGNMVEERYFGTDGEPVAINAGFSSARFTYDARGNMTAAHYFGTDGEPVLHNEGNASLERAYDARGNMIEVRYFGTDGEPVINSAGFASARYEYDARGDMTAAYYYGTDGEPVLHRDGNASYERTYDARGNMVEERYFGTDGEPVLVFGGYASVAYEYDARGNQTSVRYLGTDAKPVLVQLGYASMVKDYDLRGFVTREKVFGIDGRPTVASTGFTVAEYEHDARGNLTKANAFDAEGKPVSSTDGWASFTRDYDERNNMVRESYFGPDGSPVMVKEGYATAEYAYDAQGDMVAWVYFDVDGVPIKRSLPDMEYVTEPTSGERTSSSADGYWWVSAPGEDDRQIALFLVVEDAKPTLHIVVFDGKTLETYEHNTYSDNSGIVARSAEFDLTRDEVTITEDGQTLTLRRATDNQVEFIKQVLQDDLA